MDPLVPPPVTGLPQLRQRIEQVPPAQHLRFGVYDGKGFVRGTEQQVRLCCDMWNLREQVAAALRLVEALRADPRYIARLLSGSCTCQTKTPDPAYHSDLCVYAAAVEVLPDAEQLVS